MEQRDEMSEAAIFVEELNTAASPNPVAPGEQDAARKLVFLNKRLRALRYDLARLRVELNAVLAENARLNRVVQDVAASRTWRFINRLRKVPNAVTRRMRALIQSAIRGLIGEESR